MIRRPKQSPQGYNVKEPAPFTAPIAFGKTNRVLGLMTRKREKLKGLEIAPVLMHVSKTPRGTCSSSKVIQSAFTMNV